MSKIRERFVRDLQIRNYSDNTIRNYVAAIVKLSKHYGRCPSEISGEEIKDYLQDCLNNHQSWSGTNLILSACNRLYLDTLNQPEKVQHLKRPRTVKKLPVVFSQEEVKQLIRSIRNMKHRAIIMTIYGAGLRSGEARNLKIGDVDSSRKRIVIRDPKGNRDREVILSNHLLEYLRNYVRTYQPKTYLFYGRLTSKPLSNSSLRMVFNRAVRRSGINKKGTLHTLRHSFATHLLNKGIDIRIIQQLLGHRSVKTTMIYCHLNKNKFLEIKSPLDDLDI